jgi:UrcA family protein
MSRVTKIALLCVGLGLAAGGAAADPVYGPAPYPAPYADGITVYGRPAPYRVPDYVQELSATVAYDDLDLATREGQDELNWRIARTADELCGRLGEGEEAGRNRSVLPTCQASARDGARSQVRRAVKDARNAAAYDSPAYPAYPPAPAYPQTSYAPPVYGQPTYAPPAYRQPYAQPVYQQPYVQPGYAAPVYAQPQTGWTPPPCLSACAHTAWTPPRAGW